MDAHVNQNRIRSPCKLTIPIGSNSPLRKCQQNENAPAASPNSSIHQKQCSNDSASSVHLQKPIPATTTADDQESTKKAIIAQVEHFLQGSVEQKELNDILSKLNQAVGKTSVATVSKSTSERDGANSSKATEQLNDEPAKCESVCTPTNKTTTQNDSEIPGPSGEQHKARSPLKSPAIEQESVTVDKEKKKGTIYFICLHCTAI